MQMTRSTHPWLLAKQDSLLIERRPTARLVVRDDVKVTVVVVD